MTTKQYFGTVEQQDIARIKDLEQEYIDVIKLLQDNGAQGNYALIKEAERKIARLKMKRLEIESKGLV